MAETRGPEVVHHPSRVLATLRRLIRARITAGLITILPVVVTIWLVMLVFRWLRDTSLWVLNALVLNPWGHKVLVAWGIPPEDITHEGLKSLPPPLQWGISIFSIVLTILLLYLVGMFAANVIGRRIIEWMEYLVGRVPFVKSIYSAAKQILSLFSGQQAQQFQRVALVPFPNEITRSVAFITNTFKDSVTGDDLCACFIATTPNPTTGFVFVLRRANIIEVDWTVEEAIKVIMSGGILAPTYVTMDTNAQRNARVPPATSPPAPASLTSRRTTS